MSAFDNITDRTGHELLYTQCGDALDLTELNSQQDEVAKQKEEHIHGLEVDEYAIADRQRRLGSFTLKFADYA